MLETAPIEVASSENPSTGEMAFSAASASPENALDTFPDEPSPSEQQIDLQGDAQAAMQADTQQNRIAEHIRSSLQSPSPLQAAIGAATGDLLGMQHRYQLVLEHALQRSPDALTAISGLTSQLNLFLKIGQQAQQYAHLYLKLDASLGHQTSK